MLKMTGNKYGAKKIKDPATGFVFDSKKEFVRWCELRILERAGRITKLRRQVKFVLIPAQYDGKVKLESEVSYIADFVYKDETGAEIVEDTKGYKRGAAYQLFVIKRKLMLQKFGVRIKET